MYSAKVHFNNGEAVVISTSDIVFGIRTSENKTFYGSEKETQKQQFLFPKSASLAALELDYHPDAGMIPSLVELFSNYEFFQLEENGKTAYSSSAVSKIELL